MYPSNVKELLSEYLFPNYMASMLTGQPGCAKTDLVNESSSAAKFDQYVFHPAVSDPTDFKGMPCITTDAKGNQQAEFLPFTELRIICHAKKPTVVFMDDIGQAPASTQAACMQLLHARRLNGVRVSDKVVFVAATNRKSDRSGVSGVLEAVKSRFVTIIPVEINLDDWCTWAYENNMPPVLIAFNRWRPTHLASFEAVPEIVNTASPRTIAHVGQLYNLGLPAHLQLEAFSGAAGEAFGSEFFAFLDVHEGLPDADLAMKNPDAITMPGKDDFGTLFAFGEAIAARAERKNIGNFMKLVNRMPPENQAATVNAAKQRDPSIQEHSEIIKWISENQDFLV